MAPNTIDEVCAQSQLVEETATSFVSGIKHRNVTKPDKADEIGKKENESFSFADLKWFNIISLTSLHLLALYGLFYFPMNGFPISWKTIVWSLFIGHMGAFGVTAGAHRYWTHRTYKAKKPLQILLVFFYLFAGHNSPLNWVRDHRVHHKYSETNADPHNSNRGFFFSHVGWLMVKKHPEVIKKGKLLDISDITNDPILMFFERFYIPLYLLFVFVIPIGIPIYFWNENVTSSILYQIMRYVFILNGTWSVNSLAHIYGNKPYNKNIAPVENLFVTIISVGEGWHNYHHVFPYDYRTAELCSNRLNLTTCLIDFFAKIGWAYDLKTPSESAIRKAIARQGDGTHQRAQEFTEKEEVSGELDESTQ